MQERMQRENESTKKETRVIIIVKRFKIAFYLRDIKPAVCGAKPPSGARFAKPCNQPRRPQTPNDCATEMPGR